MREAGQIRADRGQLEQVLINLVLNARDAISGHGRVTIETATTVWDRAYAERHEGVELPLGRYMMLAVSDTGCGMDPDVQARIFEPFYTTKAVGQGTGLGLSTVYGIVKQSGGFVWVYSEPDQGSVFKVYLPEASAATAAEVPADPMTAPTGGSETILVIEDEDVVRNLFPRAGRTRLSGNPSREWSRSPPLCPGTSRHHSAGDFRCGHARNGREGVGPASGPQ